MKPFISSFEFLSIFISLRSLDYYRFWDPWSKGPMKCLPSICLILCLSEVFLRKCSQKLSDFCTKLGIPKKSYSTIGGPKGPNRPSMSFSMFMKKQQVEFLWIFAWSYSKMKSERCPNWVKNEVFQELSKVSVWNFFDFLREVIAA